MSPRQSDEMSQRSKDSRIWSVLHQDEGGIGKSSPMPKRFPEGNLEGRGRRGWISCVKINSSLLMMKEWTLFDFRGLIEY